MYLLQNNRKKPKAYSSPISNQERRRQREGEKEKEMLFISTDTLNAFLLVKFKPKSGN